MVRSADDLARQPSDQAAKTIVHIFAGSPDQVSHARKLLSGFLGEFARADDLVLILSELATNAVLHSRSSEPGGQFTIRATCCPECYASLEVTDQGGLWIGDGENFPDGHGLSIVGSLADRWEITGNEDGRTVLAFIYARPSATTAAPA